MIEHTLDTRTRRPAIRAQLAVLALFLLAAALAWWWTAQRMAGMDAGPGSELGTLGWFTGAWVVMMAAMMLPALAPTAAARAASATPLTAPPSAAAASRRLAHSLLFAAGYLLVWTAIGLAAYAAFALARDLLAAQLAWHAAGRWVAGGALAFAAAYELTPLKARCLTRCRDTRAFAAGPREKPAGALAAGVRNGCWCLGCSGALMVALFALGAMSLTWMALLAALVALQKLAPAPVRRTAVAATVTLLLALAVALPAAPHDVPGLVVPGGRAHAMRAMSAMPTGKASMREPAGMSRTPRRAPNP